MPDAYPDHVREEALRRFDAGEKIAEILGVCGISESTLRKWRGDRPTRSNQIPTSVRDKAVRMFVAGEKMAYIEAALKISRRTLSVWTWSQGIREQRRRALEVLRPLRLERGVTQNPQMSDDLVDIIVEAYKAGESSIKVAKRIGVARTTVLRYARLRGVTVRGQGPKNQAIPRNAASNTTPDTVSSGG